MPVYSNVSLKTVQPKSTGRLYRNDWDTEFKNPVFHAVSTQAGILIGFGQSMAGDFNKDRWPDLTVLFGTGDEGLWLFTNDQKDSYTSRNLLRFPPLYGSTSFELVDEP